MPVVSKRENLIVEVQKEKEESGVFFHWIIYRSDRDELVAWGKERDFGKAKKRATGALNELMSEGRAA